MSIDTPRSPKTVPPLNRDLQRHLGGKVREIHEPVVREPLPEPMRRLLDDLEGRAKPDPRRRN